MTDLDISMLSYSDPLKCENCNTIMERIEDINGCEITYQWNTKTKEYDKIDTNLYGECYTRYDCPKCGNSISEIDREELEY